MGHEGLLLVGVDVAIHTEPGRPSPVQDPSAETCVTRPQPPRAIQLGLVLNAVILHTTCLTDQTLDNLRNSGHPVHNEAAAQLSPFIHDHINLRGRYTFEFKEVTNGPRFAPDSGSTTTD
ncbi:Tn3 family transposase [Streptomyces katrae]|uniref:Tn3 family transposase n=1 Tax=Streptomyces katrae TaxID=68223 RepID=UPI0013319C7C